eukprot:7063223-Pyramimonas_sp.AAC.1
MQTRSADDAHIARCETDALLACCESGHAAQYTLPHVGLPATDPDAPNPEVPRPAGAPARFVLHVYRG